MRPAGPKAVAAVAAAGLTVLVVAAVAACSSGPSKPSNLLPTGVAFKPAGQVVYAPEGLGVAMMLPADWRSVAARSDSQFEADGPAGQGDFVLAGSNSSVIPVSIARVVSSRTGFLSGRGARVTSSATGRVDGRPAARLTYVITEQGTSVYDTEFDIITTSPLAAGANQHQTIYVVTSVALGAFKPWVTQDQPLLAWIASTIRVP